MNTLFPDEVQVAKETSVSSIPFEGAVARVNALNWGQIGKDLDEQGSALLQGVLSADECKGVASLYPEQSIFRSRVVMGRHGFGRGEYKYFSYPLLPSFMVSARRSILSSLRSRIAGTRQWESRCAIQ